MKFSKLLLLIGLVALVTACSEKPISREQVMKENGAVHKENSFDYKTVEEQIEQGRNNATVVAQDYQRQSERLTGWPGMIVKADTTQSETCPQGDGWTEVVFQKTRKDDTGKPVLNANGKEVIEKATLMCSTISVNRGCVMVSVTGADVNNWNTHPGKAQDGKCASTNAVPYPLPKLTGLK